MLLTPLANANYEYSVEKENDIHPVWGVLIMEGFVVANSIWASNKPAEFGTALALLSPIAGCSSHYCMGLIAAESIALYNLTVDTETTSKDEILRNNIIAWHLMAGAVMLTGYLIDEPDVKLGFYPIIDGAGLQFSYVF